MEQNKQSAQMLIFPKPDIYPAKRKCQEKDSGTGRGKEAPHRLDPAQRILYTRIDTIIL